jgi:hypothetical protein
MTRPMGYIHWVKDHRLKELEGFVQYLLDEFVVTPEGCFTFPNGETWECKATPSGTAGGIAPSLAIAEELDRQATTKPEYERYGKE